MKVLIPENRGGDFEEWLRDRGEGWERQEPFGSMRAYVVADSLAVRSKVRTLGGSHGWGDDEWKPITNSPA